MDAGPRPAMAERGSHGAQPSPAVARTPLASVRQSPGAQSLQPAGQAGRPPGVASIRGHGRADHGPGRSRPPTSRAASRLASCRAAERAGRPLGVASTGGRDRSDHGPGRSRPSAGRATSRRHLDHRVRRLAEHLRRVHRLDPRRRQREAPGLVQAHACTRIDVLAARQVLVVAAEGLEAAFLEGRPAARPSASRRASRSANRGRGRCRGWSRRPAPGR